MMKRKNIEFWFDLGSNYSYLTAMRIDALAAEKSISVTWKPFLLGQIFKRFGWDSSPFVLQKEKGKYTWVDMKRQCAKYDIPWKQPSAFPRAAVYPMRVAAANESESWVGEFCRRMFVANFAEDQDINSNDFVIKTINSMGGDGRTIVDLAQSDEAKAKLRTQTEEAIARGIFGAPTFFASGEMFWGNDRLEDALAELDG
jgi:2-hydroxychromene-2-carboxylate isomerase